MILKKIKYKKFMLKNLLHHDFKKKIFHTVNLKKIIILK